MSNEKIKPDYETLYFLYVKQNFTQEQIAKNFNVSKSTVRRWLKSYEIKKCNCSLHKAVESIFYKIVNRIVKWIVSKFSKGN